VDTLSNNIPDETTKSRQKAYYISEFHVEFLKFSPLI